jgi:hypothetical protein
MVEGAVLPAVPPADARIWRQPRTAVDWLAAAGFGGVAVLMWVYTAVALVFQWSDDPANLAPVLVVAPAFAFLLIWAVDRIRRLMVVAFDGHHVWCRVPTYGGLGSTWSSPVALGQVAEVVPSSMDRAGGLPLPVALTPGPGRLHLGEIVPAGVSVGEVCSKTFYALHLVPAGSPPVQRHRLDWFPLNRPVSPPEVRAAAVGVPLWDTFRGPLAGSPELLVQLAPSLLASASMPDEVRAALTAVVASGGDVSRFDEVVVPVLSLLRQDR